MYSSTCPHHQTPSNKFSPDKGLSRIRAWASDQRRPIPALPNPRPLVNQNLTSKNPLRIDHAPHDQRILDQTRRTTVKWLLFIDKIELMGIGRLIHDPFAGLDSYTTKTLRCFALECRWTNLQNETDLALETIFGTCAVAADDDASLRLVGTDVSRD